MAICWKIIATSRHGSNLAYKLDKAAAGGDLTDFAVAADGAHA
jgi:hypothetical protein